MTRKRTKFNGHPIVPAKQESNTDRTEKKQYNYKRKPNGKNDVGAPAMYDPEYHPAKAYALLSSGGFSNDEICVALDIARGTFDTWMREHSDFKCAIKEGRYNWDSVHIVKALKKRALGYAYDEVKIEETHVKGSDLGLPDTEVVIPAVRRTVTKKQVAPSDTAIMFWLQNRQPEDWKNVRRVENTGEVHHKYSGKIDINHKGKIDLKKLEREEIEGLRDVIERASTEASNN